MIRRKKHPKDYRISVKSDDPTEKVTHVVAIEHLTGDWDFSYWGTYLTTDARTVWYVNDHGYTTAIAEACTNIEMFRQRDEARRNVKIVTCS